MEWEHRNDSSVLITEYFRDKSETSNNILFISLQNCLVKSKSGKSKADKNSWIFFSDNTPSFLDEQLEWEVVLFDHNKTKISPDYFVMITDIINSLNRDVYVIISPTLNIVPIFESISGVIPSPASCVVGGNVGEYSDNVLYNGSNIDALIAHTGNINAIYPPYDIFPSQMQFQFPVYQALYLTVGQANSGRREFFNNIQNIVEVEKKGNWSNKIRKNLMSGYSVVLQAMNQSRSDREPAILMARELNIPVIILWFSTRGKPFEKVTGEVRPSKVYERYTSSFQEPTSDEGEVYRLN